MGWPVVRREERGGVAGVGLGMRGCWMKEVRRSLMAATYKDYLPRKARSNTLSINMLRAYLLNLHLLQPLQNRDDAIL